LALLAISLVAWVAFAAAANRWMHLRSKDGAGERAGLVAAAYMTALGSLFAILTAFLINAEYTSLRQTNTLISSESAAASRLAYSSEGLPAADVERVQDLLVTYLEAVERDEWRALASNEPENSRAFTALKDLKSAVFEIATSSYAPTASTDGMQDAVSSLTSIRRERVAIASQELPVALVALSALAGVALVINALVVTLRAGPRYTLVAWGIVVVVALDLAAILAIAGPFRGAFQASKAPIASLAGELRDGRYIPWLPGDSPEPPSRSSEDCPSAGEAVAAVEAAGGSEPPTCIEIGIGEPVRIGVLAWLSGDSSAGEDALLGSELAVDYLDGRFDGIPGQLLGHDVVLSVADEGCTPEAGRRAAAAAASEPDLLGVVGTTCSAAALDAADRELSERSILLVSPANTAPGLTTDEQHERFYFRTIFNDIIQGSVVADFVGRTAGSRPVAVVSDGNPYSEALADVFDREVRRSKRSPIVRLRTTSGSDVPSLEGSLEPSVVADRLAEVVPSAVFLPTFDPRCTELARELRARPSLAFTTIIVAEACQSTDLLDVLGASADGILASGPDVSGFAEGAFYSQALRPGLERQLGGPPVGVYHTYAFDATNVLLSALRRAAFRLPGGALRVDREALRAAMLDVDGYPGVSGQLTCRPNGECAQAARIALYRAPAWPVARVEPPPPEFSQTKTLASVVGTG
jgi:branched-chain amino acid transport system substrate-binding protein